MLILKFEIRHCVNTIYHQLAWSCIIFWLKTTLRSMPESRESLLMMNPIIRSYQICDFFCEFNQLLCKLWVITISKDRNIGEYKCCTQNPRFWSSSFYHHNRYGRRKKTKQVLRNYQSYSIDLFSEQFFRDSPPGGGNDHEPLRGLIKKQTFEQIFCTPLTIHDCAHQSRFK